MTISLTPSRHRLLAGTATVLVLAAALPALGQEQAQTGDAAEVSVAVGELVVSARHRSERIQDVPIPISRISGEDLARDNDVNITDFTRKLPNVSVNSPNARQTSIAIRGVGKNSANDSMEASV